MSISAEQYMQAMTQCFRPDRAQGLNTTYALELHGAGTWTIAVSNEQVQISTGKPSRANCTIKMSVDSYLKLAEGRLDVGSAYSRGEIKVDGDTQLALKFTQIFSPWADTARKGGSTPPPARPSQPAPTAPKPEPTRPSAPTPEPTSEPAPAQPAAPVSGDVYPHFMNSSFDEYQPFVYEGEAKVWKENRFPEEYGKYWKLDIVKVGKGRFHAMSSKVFAGFTQAYFGGGGHDYHIEGHHSQVFTSQKSFDIVLSQTFAAELGRSYTFSGAIVSFYKGTSGEQKDGEIFKSIGIDPTGGQAWNSDSVIWTDRDGKDNHWRYPSIKAKAQANAISVFIRLENTTRDVGRTELNTIHLDKFKVE